MAPPQSRSLFAHVTAAAPDAILGLTEAFAAEKRPEKINLGVGVYKDASGATPVLASVKEAEGRILAEEKTKGYKPIAGDPAYRRLVRELLFGDGHDLVAGRRAETADTPGGTGALRVAADYLKNEHPSATVWLSDPTWANHGAIFEAVGVPTRTYAYYDPAAFGLDFDAMVGSLADAAAGDVVLLHGCCHNPTGADLDGAQWERLGLLLADRRLLPMVDFAYQGFAEGIESDAAGLRTLVAVCDELLVCSSFSKNFGLYNERVGALTVVAADPGAAVAVFSKVQQAIRRSYSNPPAHGASIVTTILADADLRLAWEAELAAMRERIYAMRRLFADRLDGRGVTLSPAGNRFVVDQRGMFSFTGLSHQQVTALRERHAIYMVGSGRINVAGITEANCDRLCDAIAEVVGR